MKHNAFIAIAMMVTLLAACTNNQKMNQDMKQAAFITASQGEEVIGRPYEYYVNGIDAAFTADGQFKVFWNLKG